MPRKYTTDQKQINRTSKAGKGTPADAAIPGIVLYRAPNGKVRLEVRLERETLWMTQKQMAALFETERSVVTKHLKNIFSTRELEEKSNVQKMHIAPSDKPVAFYNLDVIISLGYRVNSRRGTQFRIWANSVLREHILKGYTINTRRLKELNKAVRLIADVAGRRSLAGDEATAILRVVADYSFALDLLDDYDHKTVAMPEPTKAKILRLDYEEVLRIVGRLREKYRVSELFGREKDHGLESALGAVWQTVGGRDAYPSLEEKAANLLYFVVKNHAFVDGNKRIAAAVFLWFLEKNAALYGRNGAKRIEDNALVAMTLLIAESHPEEKDLLCRVLVNLIRGRAL